MALAFVLLAIIFTLLAIVVATSLLNGSPPPADFIGASGRFGGGAAGGEGRSAAKHNGHVPERKKTEDEVEEEEVTKEPAGASDDWGELSGSSHDHWDVVKSVQSEEEHPHTHTEDLPPPVDHSTSAAGLSAPRPESRNASLDSSSEALSGRGQRSFIGLSDKELLKCAFSFPQTEGATESPDSNENKVESNANNSLNYIPGKARSHHMEMMMSKEELEEEQRVQREQLAAIFQLLKDNTETFGEVSEGDMEEQLRLYSI